MSPEIPEHGNRHHERFFGAHVDPTFGAVTGLFGDKPIQIGIVTTEPDNVRNQSGNVRNRFDIART